MPAPGLRRGLAVVACLSLLPSAACVNVQLFGGLPKPLTETVVLGDTGPKILMVQVDGLISMQEPEPDLIGPRRESLVARIREVLEMAGKDPEVRALLLRIDSPGGTATASDVVYREILRFKRDREVPVVAHMLGTATSGAYYVAMAADVVVAHPTTVTGSIGVLFMGVSLAGLMEKLGVEDQTLKSGPYKDAGSPLRRMTRQERAQIQSVIDDLHARFERVVDAGRPGLDAAAVAELADGRIFSARQARENGLVDELGDLEKAAGVARDRAGLEAARVVVYHRRTEFENNLFTRSPMPRAVRLELPEPLSWSLRPGFYFLWAPALQ